MVNDDFAHDPGLPDDTDGGLDLGTLAVASVLEMDDGTAVLAIKGHDASARVTIPPDMVAPFEDTVGELSRVYDDDSTDDTLIGDGGLSTDQQCDRDGCTGDARHPVEANGGEYCCVPCAHADAPPGAEDPSLPGVEGGGSTAEDGETGPEHGDGAGTDDGEPPCEFPGCDDTLGEFPDPHPVPVGGAGGDTDRLRMCDTHAVAARLLTTTRPSHPYVAQGLYPRVAYYARQLAAAKLDFEHPPDVVRQPDPEDVDGPDDPGETVGRGGPADANADADAHAGDDWRRDRDARGAGGVR